jgi:hypothetical protein
VVWQGRAVIRSPYADLAPQRGLIATVKSKNNSPDAIHSYIGFGKNKEQLRVEYSRNSQSLTASPAEPGELPFRISAYFCV